MAERQLQAAQDQIKQLDETLAYWKKLLDGTQDGIDATMSVADAVKALTLLMFPQTPAQAASAGSGGFAIGGSAPGQSNRLAPAASTLSRLGNTYIGAGGTAITDATYVDRFDSINQFVNTLNWSDANKAASAAAVAAAAQQYGVSQREIAIATGYSDADIARLFPDLPKYAMGTNFVPADGLAYLHKGEQIVPAAPQGAPYQPTASDSGQVVALLQQIAQRVTALEGHAANTAEASDRSAEVLTRVSQGNSLTTSAAPAIA
jgi:hypothetical protein